VLLLLVRRGKQQEWSPAQRIRERLIPELNRVPRILGPQEILSLRFRRGLKTLQHGLMSSLLMLFTNEIQNCWMQLIVE
jgi:hypothetical protein